MPKNIKEIFDFKKARLVTTTKNNKPYYYVEFSAYDAIKGKLRRKRIYTINSINNLEQRESTGLKLVNDIKRKEHDIIEISNANYKTYTLETALDYALEIKKHQLAHKSYANYKHSKNYILKYSDYHSLRHQNIRNLNDFRTQPCF